MRLFVVCSRLCAGGAERVGVVLANGFAEEGHEVYLLSNTNLEIAYPISTSVHVVNIFPNTTNKFKKWIGASVQMRKEIKKHHPDVILGIEETCSLMAKIASVGQGAHVICTEHNSYQRPLSAPMGRMEWFMKYHMTKIYECVTVLTDADRVFIGSKLDNVVVMPNPLAVKPVEQIPKKEKIILAAGRLDVWHYKGFDLLIRAYAKAVSSSSHSEAAEPSVKNQVSSSSHSEATDAAFKRPEGRSKAASCVQGSISLQWRLQIAGTGSEESLEYLKQLCKENGVEDSVDFLGFRTDIEELYKQSEIFVLSSRYEGFGLVLIEAMSQGCACVACDYKGRQREIICPEGANDSSFSVDTLKAAKPSTKNQVSKELESGAIETCNLKPETTPLRGVEVCENGILCEVESVEALAEGIKRMMEDEVYRREVQRNSIERSKAYNVDRIVHRWENLFDQIIY